jgi:hypothetical protein
MFTTDRAAVETCPLTSSLTCARSHAKRGRGTVLEALGIGVVYRRYRRIQLANVHFIRSGPTADSSPVKTVIRRALYTYFEPFTILLPSWHPRNEYRGTAEVRFLAQHLAASSEACGSGRRFFLTILRFVRAVHLDALMGGIRYRSDYAAVTSIHCGAARRMCATART